MRFKLPFFNYYNHIASCHLCDGRVEEGSLGLLDLGLLPLLDVVLVNLKIDLEKKTH